MSQQQPLLYGTSSVPYSPVSAAPSALVYSADGQYAIVTRGEINIFTPSLGYSNPAGSTLPGAQAASGIAVGGGKGKGREREELPLHRTVIPIEMKNIVRWHEWADEYDLVVPSTPRNESNWRSAAWSPSGLSGLGSCVLATLTVVGEVLLFAPSKDAAKGEWSEICDVTATLIAATMPEDDTKSDEQTPQMRREAIAWIRRCQTSALAWSSAVLSSTTDVSLLALGHRSGEVSLWRFSNGSPKLVLRFRPDGDVNWINVLSWSEWKLTAVDNGTLATATLALADADGRVWSVEISQSLSGEDNGVEASSALLVVTADGRAATQLCWVERNGSHQLVYSKLGTIHITSLAADGEAEERWRVVGEEEVELRTEGAQRWMGASAWAPCSGISYISSSDYLLVSLSSGSFHLISLSPIALLLDSDSARFTNSGRSLFEVVLARRKQQRDRFHPEGKGSISRKEGAKVLGFVGLGGGKGGVDVAYIFETERPSAFTHRTAADTRTYLVVGNLDGGEQTTEEVIAEFSQLLVSNLDPRSVPALSRVQLLLNHVSNHADDEQLVASLLQQLQPLPILPTPASTSTDRTQKLVEQLFADGGLEAVRLKEVVAKVLAKSTLPADQQHLAVLLHNSLGRQLTKEVLSRIAATVGAVELTDVEQPLHSRLLLASSSLLPNIDLAAPSETDNLPPDALAHTYEQADETCPACRAQVPLANVRYACCVQGHQWERCSLTLAVVSTVKIRTCTGCERKALLPTIGSDQGVVNEILRAATCCAYCGGRWMRVR